MFDQVLGLVRLLRYSLNNFRMVKVMKLHLKYFN